MRRLQALAALLAAVVTVPPVLADGSGPMEPFPITGAYSAFFREDREQITIIDFAGNYNKELAAGVPNVEPRAVIAREFLCASQRPLPAADESPGGAGVTGAARVAGTYSNSHSE